ncbi:MAG: LLM class flavin-dependent oxidoreductase [Acidimicrobiales bacterium]|nr:LLM class flavin-dependent oxidoreductase [Acidimicrobiales bacterium]
MTLPTMASGLDRALTNEWCAAIDEGPFRSLAIGERIAFDNLELHTTLSYAAARTERVRLAPTLVILPMHPVALMAKKLATLDVLSGGRVDVVVGVGGRDQDYRAAERSFAKRHQRLDDQVAELRRLWSGGEIGEGDPPIGPACVQPGGPPIHAGALGPLSMARAAQWAAGNMGFTLGPNTEDHAATFGAVRDAWTAAGRTEPPRLSTSFFYSLDPNAEQVLHDYAYRYLQVFGHEAAEMMAAMTTAAGPRAVADALDRLEAAGCDEVYLVPTTTNPAHVEQVASLRG